MQRQFNRRQFVKTLFADRPPFVGDQRSHAFTRFFDQRKHGLAHVQTTGFVGRPIPRSIDDHGGFGANKLVFHALGLGSRGDHTVFEFQVQQPVKGLGRTVGIERWVAGFVKQRPVVARLKSEPPIGRFDGQRQALDVLIGEGLSGLQKVVLRPRFIGVRNTSCIKESLVVHKGQ